ncbi:MAG: hypothetical protein KVP17_001218 [Porospora cf. gigantea B]|uniref:uncharacterized protein n=1 Tax=Porospora cf. gigantea B TaxID=2853592 RepID=UPI003571CC2B|nr:MAG: hypothetical protein KVP17_001218 [Porospora cf. gigantea B]
MLILCPPNRGACELGLLASVLGEVRPDLLEACSQKTGGSPEIPTACSVPSAANAVSYWKHHYEAEDACPALQALVPPNELLEFYNEDVPLAIKHKSFLFTCVVGLGPVVLDETKDSPSAARLRMLSPPERSDLAIFDASTLRRLSAFHALDMCDTADHVVSDVGVFECLTTADRQQYLRESSVNNAIVPLNAARWFYLDAAKEASSLTLPELRVAILVDMSLILLQMSAECETSHGIGFSVATFVMCSALILLSFDDDADTRLAYCMVQLSFQAVRCWLLNLSGTQHVDEHTCDGWIGFLSNREAMRVGWRRLLSFSGRREDHDINEILDQTTLYTLLVNPFRISGMQWKDVESLGPNTELNIPEDLRNHSFSLDSTFFAWKPEAHSTNEESRDRLDALERHVISSFGSVESPFTNRLWKNNRRRLRMPEDSPDTLGVVSQWITERPRPGTLLGDVNWPDEDPSRVGVRLTLATAVSAGLTSSSPEWFKMHRERDARLLVAINRASMKLVLLAKTMPQCYCQQAHRRPSDRQKILEDLRPFCDPLAPGLALRPGCDLDNNSGRFGYEADEIPKAWLAQTPSCRSFSTKREMLLWRLKNRPALQRPTENRSAVQRPTESADSVSRSHESESRHKKGKKPKRVQQKAVAAAVKDTRHITLQATLEVEDEFVDRESAPLDGEPHTSDPRFRSLLARGPRPRVSSTSILTWDEQLQDLGTVSVVAFTAEFPQ